MNLHHFFGAASLAATALLGAQAAQAAVSTQTQNFNITTAAITDGTGSGNLTVATGTDLTATFNTFDASLGTLESFTFTWNLTYSADGVVGTEPSFTGYAYISGGGDLKINSYAYTGLGGGNSDSGTLGDSLTPSYNNTKSDTFAAASAGITYNPAMLSWVMGGSGSTFNMVFNQNVSLSYGRVVDLTSSVIGSVKVDYTYTPSAAPVPEAQTYAMFGAGLLVLGAVRRRRNRHVTRQA